MRIHTCTQALPCTRKTKCDVWHRHRCLKCDQTSHTAIKSNILQSGITRVHTRKITLSPLSCKHTHVHTRSKISCCMWNYTRSTCTHKQSSYSCTSNTHTHTHTPQSKCHAPFGIWRAEMSEHWQILKVFISFHR